METRMRFTLCDLRFWPPLLVVVAAACSVPARVPPAWAEPQAAAPEPPLSFGAAPAEAIPVAEADADVPAASGIPDAEYPGGCLSCTGSPRLVPVCRRVPVTKKKPHVEYEMKCELVCVPGCGCFKHGTAHAGCTDCDDSRCDDVRVRQKKLLVKTITEKETESYEYKVEWVCADCAAGRTCCGSGPVSGLSEFFSNVFR
jgi:hypothetical protein